MNPREAASDPDTSLGRLLLLATDFPVEVLTNPRLSLESLVDPAKAMKVYLQAWASLSSKAWSEVTEMGAEPQHVEKFYSWAIEFAKREFPENAPYLHLGHVHRMGVHSSFRVDQIEDEMQKILAAADTSDLGQIHSWEGVKVRAACADALSQIMTGRPYPWPTTDMKPNRRRGGRRTRRQV